MADTFIVPSRYVTAEGVSQVSTMKTHLILYTLPHKVGTTEPSSVVMYVSGSMEVFAIFEARVVCHDMCLGL